MHCDSSYGGRGDGSTNSLRLAWAEKHETQAKNEGKRAGALGQRACLELQSPDLKPQ
jgi:hypothetical protein